MSVIEIDNPESPALVLGPRLAGTLMSPQEFDSVAYIDDGFVYELIHGVLIVAPPPLEEERGPNDELGLMLRLYKLNHPDGKSLDDTLPEQYVRTPVNRRRADRVIWAGLGRAPNPLVDVPTIAVEFVSEGKRSRLRDYDEKAAEYRDCGIGEYWIVDRFRRTMTAFRSDGTEVVIVARGIYRTPLLPGFELPLDRLLEVADRWKASKQAP
jgi:Uma2 family endonuclease